MTNDFSNQQTMRSMTGFGHAEKSFGDLDISIDIKTTNGRYLDLNIKLPRELSPLEPELRKEIQNRLSRGRVEVFVNLAFRAADQFEIDESMVENYLKMAEKIRSPLGESSFNILTLFQLPGVIRPRQFESSQETIESVLEVECQALDMVEASRTAEGASIKADLEERVRALEDFVERVASGSGKIRDYYREKLIQRIRELTQERVVDENRLAQEVLYYAERYDVSEEIARLRGHLERFRQYLGDSDREHIGKNLDFLCQEMNREMNTLLSKSPLAEISGLGVDGKVEIERIREQVQNVE